MGIYFVNIISTIATCNGYSSELELRKNFDISKNLSNLTPKPKNGNQICSIQNWKQILF